MVKIYNTHLSIIYSNKNSFPTREWFKILLYLYHEIISRHKNNVFESYLMV